MGGQSVPFKTDDLMEATGGDKINNTLEKKGVFGPGRSEGV